MRTGKLWAAFRPYLWITLASAVFALGFDWCYVPNQITLGGMTGLGQIIHAIVPAIPVGSAVIALNLPLFLLGWRLLGWKLLASSLFATAATSLGVDLLAACYSFPPMDPMLASVFGGALIGLSLGMVFLQGATTGGTDLIARLLKLRFGHLPMGTLVMAVDLVATVRTIAKINRNLRQIDELAAKIKSASNEFGENLADRVLDAAEKGADLREELAERGEDLKENLADLKEDLTDHWEEHQMDQALRRAERQESLEELRRRLSEVMDQRIFGQRRLLSAFPKMRSLDHKQALEALRRQMEQLRDGRKS